MMTTFYARIAPPNSTVQEVIDFNPVGFFPREWIWVEIPEELVPDAVERGLRYQGGEFIEPPPPRYYTLKDDIWDKSRITDEEAEVVDGIISDSSALVRRRWSEGNQVWHDSDIYQTVYQAAISALGQEAADRIFAASGQE